MCPKRYPPSLRPHSSSPFLCSLQQLSATVYQGLLYYLRNTLLLHGKYFPEEHLPVNEVCRWTFFLVQAIHTPQTNTIWGTGTQVRRTNWEWSPGQRRAGQGQKLEPQRMCGETKWVSCAWCVLCVSDTCCVGWVGPSPSPHREGASPVIRGLGWVPAKSITGATRQNSLFQRNYPIKRKVIMVKKITNGSFEGFYRYFS